MTKMLLRDRLRLLEPGRPCLIHGISVEKILNLYKIGGQDQLLTMSEALTLMGETGTPEKTKDEILHYPEVPDEPIYPETLRALSIGGACGLAILDGVQGLETRGWKTTFRGPVLIHVSTTRQWDHSYEIYNIGVDECPKASIIGAATLTDCAQVGNGEPPRFRPLYGHKLDEPIIFRHPIRNVSGQRNYWRPKPGDIKTIRAFNIAWTWIQEFQDEGESETD